MSHYLHIIRTENRDMLLAPLDAFCIEILGSLTTAADPGEHPGVQERLFPDPAPPEEFETNEEWAEYVAPGLRQSFAEHLAIIEQDLSNIASPEELTTSARVAEETPGGSPGDMPMLRIPASHLESWVHGLNQARLALHARHGISESDGEWDIDSAQPEQAFAVAQMHFYGMLLELLVQALDAET